MSKRLLALLLLCSISFPSLAQEITFTAETVSGNGQVVPALSWDTVPSADSCVASGGWTGEKGASGSETLPAIFGSATFTLTCTWASDGDVTLTWVNPTENTDGSPYTNRGVTIIDYSPDGAEPWFMQVVTDPLATTATVADLDPGDWTFRARAVNADELSSAPSESVVRTVEPDMNAEERISITVNPLPLPPTGLAAQ